MRKNRTSGPLRSAPAGPAAALQAIRRLVAALQASARAVEIRTGVTNAQLFLLRALEERDQLAIGELAVMARTQQSTVSIIVQRLVRNGLVSRRASPDDARRVLLTLTVQGRATLRHAPVPPTARLLSALQDLAPAERRALLRGLEALHRNLGLKGEEPGMLFETVGEGRPGREGGTNPRKARTQGGRRAVTPG
jgi:MarR family transcriptional regulator, lower aerobic nicotinate degradation pathway regulator